MSEIMVIENYALAYTLLPCRRNQDVVKIFPGKKGFEYLVAVVDGWSNENYFAGNKEGVAVAEFVAQRFPEIFVKLSEPDWVKRGDKTAEMVDSEVLTRYPMHVACAGNFLFSGFKQDIIVAIGTINTFLWRGSQWIKPVEIGDYFLPTPQYPSGSSRFFGRGELKHDPFYSAKPDVVVCSANTPVLIATDGLDDVLSLNDINTQLGSLPQKTAKSIVSSLLAEIKKRNRQKDDIAILTRFFQ